MLNTDRLCLGCMNDKGDEKVCPICGYDSSSKNPKGTLPAKLWIKDRYLVGKIISSNGEGISYIGWDNGENSIVIIREYFPIDAARRNPDSTVSIVKDKEYTFNEGLMTFKEINEILIENAISGVLPVNDVFEENGTIYAIYKHISAIPLREFLTKNGGTIEWKQAKLLFMPLLDTVSSVNDLGIIHRGISPETVLVGKDGKLYLSGFAVKGLRRTDSDFVPQIFPGYAAIEQYGIDGMDEGKHTDVYGVCATIFRTLIGAVPPEAIARINNDSMTIPARFADIIPRNVLSALANGLQVNPKDRTANMKMLIEAFSVQIEEAPSIEDIKKKRNNDSVIGTSKNGKKGVKYAVISAVCTAVVFIVLGGILAGTVFKEALFGTEDVSTEPTESYSSAPSVEQIGEVDSQYVESVKLYKVPNLKGKYYSEIVSANEESELANFKITVKDKDYSDKYARGMICSQSVKEGKEVEKETEISVVISLGPKEIKIANLVGLETDKAVLELLKQGFLYNNIIIEEMYNSEKAPGTVLEQEPKYGASVNTEEPVKIYINSYTGLDDEPMDGEYDDSITIPMN